VLVVDFIRRFRDKQEVTPQELRAFVLDIARGAVPDYQASA
jgi:thymidine phosphorylase